MRDEVKKIRGRITDLDNHQKDKLYRKALSNLPYYDDIKDHIKFSFRKSGGDFVGVSVDVGINILSNILHSIINGDYASQTLPFKKHEKIAELYVPTESDVEQALDQVNDGEETDLDLVLNQIEKNALAKNKTLKHNWRLSTEKDIKSGWTKP